MNIKELREEEKLSQKQFAEKYHLNVRTLQNWEQNKNEAPKYVLNFIKSIHDSNRDLDRIKNITFKLDKPFKVCIKDEFLNCDKIFPIQQRKVAEILDNIKNNKNVVKVIVFGSSVTYQCHQGSDVDIYFELQENVNPLIKSYNFDYDYWDNFSVDERLYLEIMKKGVIVYER